MNKLDLRKIIIFLLLIIGVFGLIFFSEWISFEALKENRAEIAEFRDKNFTLSIISFWIFYVTLVVFSLPGAAVASVSGGFLFGLGGGLIINVTAASTGATLLFVLVRYGVKSFNYNKSNKFNSNFVFRIKNALVTNQISIMLTLRLVPVVPFFLANILPALVGVRLFNFIWTTIIGIIPGGIVFTWIGVGVGEVFDRNEYPSLELLFSPVILGPILGLVALLILPMILRRSGIMSKTITERGNEKN
ncbi:MAG: VTT domain-containing protein [Paracoccaceae bacterium]